VADSCGHGEEPSSSIKGGTFLDYLIDFHLLKKGSGEDVLGSGRIAPRIFDLAECTLNS
jgi:hypothetical protein